MQDRLSSFDYNLLEELIAQTPLEDRASARLLHLERQTGHVHHRTFRDFPNLLNEGDVLVVNDTRVTALKLEGLRVGTGGKIELLALQELDPQTFVCLAKPAKRLTQGSKVEFEGGFEGEVTKVHEDGKRTIHFPDPEFRSKIDRAAAVPLPPYIHQRILDPERYQTVYNSAGGSAAAPTAGLHFTPDLLTEIEAKGVKVARVTLNVSIDTFKPVAVENLDEHKMHGELCRVTPESAEIVNGRVGRLIAVGTTSVRTIESFTDEAGQLQSGEMLSKLFIRPGYRFRNVQGIVTNFHMPKTSMLMMLSAFSSRDYILDAYREAIQEQYRFLSFGDSMLIL